ncbi:metallophosphoesterase [Flavobacterium sp. J27]|uniref:metallophosphoesterase n=1 Tax=Flavobacterium sp. J27 TaxID=2060419 RepID=UPI001F11259A|nr:metallophosphoesterase [Flavobacterium sp. J27]
MIKITGVLCTILFLNSCATYSVQTGRNLKEPVADIQVNANQVDYTFYLVGDAGNANEINSKEALLPLESQLQNAATNSTLIYLGDNVYPVGMSDDKNSEAYKTAEKILENQLSITKKYKGKTLVIPGNHDWYSGLKGLNNQEDFVVKYLNDKKSFSPRKGCPIEDFEINDNITLITINSQWYLEDWNKIPTINDDCTIKSRDEFFGEFESLLNKNQDKIVIVAMHHPLFTNGVHGGHFGVKKMLISAEASFPVPLLGTLYNLLRKTSGVSTQDVLNKDYMTMSKRIQTLIQKHENIIVVSGHEHSLEYIEKNGIKQIVSGSGTKTDAARAIYPNDFSYGKNGFAKLELLKSGQGVLTFFGKENGKEIVLYKQTILEPVNTETKDYPDTFPEYVEATVYKPENTKRSNFYNFLWGKHYRNYYGTPIKARVATIDTLFGGLKIDREGGGQQSNSLRVVDNTKKEYVLRAVKKNATRFFQAAVFVDQYVQDDLKNTYVETFLMDFFTTGHPFTAFIIDDLSKNIAIYHANPKLYYIPKHDALGKFNSSFGDELYMVQERESDSQLDETSFGKPNDIIGTDDLFKKLRKDEKYKVDEAAFIRARLFDMLLGDWDRHSDQWKWSEFKISDDEISYKPIPKDRDQAFPKYGGVLMSLILNLPEFRKMQTYDGEIQNLKWLNHVGYKLDMAFLQSNKKEDWMAQAQFIQNNLTDAVIDAAFLQLPVEVQDATSEKLKTDLKSRRDHLQEYAEKYYKLLEKRAILVGTDKKEDFYIKKISPTEIEVTQIRNKKDGKEQLIRKRTFNSKNTKEIWIYGLDDDDKFIVEGNFKSKIKIRLIGGQNNDTYKIENGHHVKIYDYKSKDNTLETDHKTATRLSDNYEMNVYSYKKANYSSFSTIPGGGFNPDDGLKLGVIMNYVHNGFRQNPYTSKHTISPNYFFATNGFEVKYKGHFPKLLGTFDFNIDSKFTSPNFTINYFGYGNESVYNDLDEDIDFDYNRVKLSTINFFPSINRVGRKGSILTFQLGFENLEVEKIADRFVSIPNVLEDRLFTNQQFASTKLAYGFENYDIVSLPTYGMGFLLSAEWKSNLNVENKNFVTLESKFNFSHKIATNGNLVFETLFRGKILTNDNFDFYHAAAIGGNNGLRGVRNERFIGRQSFYQTSDLRLTLGSIKRSFIPMKYGIIGGFDYGRVWTSNDTSNTWHTSYGGALWLNGINMITAKAGYFKNPNDKGRLTFAVQFGF